MEWGWKIYVIGIGTPILALLVVIGIGGVISNTYHYLKLKKRKQEPKIISENVNLKWEITNSEIKERAGKILKRNIVGIAIAIIAYIFINKYSYSELLKVFSSDGEIIIAILALLIIIIAVYYRWLTNERKYVMDNKGIFVTKGNRSKFFNWNEFDHFSLYFNAEKEENHDIIGKRFYLQIKSISLSSIIFNKVLLVQAEPENEKEIYEKLSKILPEKFNIKVPSCSFTKIIFR